MPPQEKETLIQRSSENDLESRPLSAIEVQMDNINATICYAAVVQLREPLDKERMAKAWANSRATEPHLQVSTKGGWIQQVPEELWQEPEFLEVPESNFRQAQMEANIRLGEMKNENTCSHLIVCQDGLKIQLIIRIPHSISDGTSLMLIVNHILSQYDNLQRPKVNSPLPRPASELQPEIDPKFIENFKKRYHRDLIEFKNTVPHELVENRNGNAFLTTGFGTPEGAANLLKFCRANGITIGSFLAASVTFINAQMTKTFNENFKLDVDYNLRDRFPKKIGNNTVSCYIGWPSLRPNAIPSDSLLAVAKKIHQELKLQMSEESHHQFDSIADLLKENGAIYDAIAAENNGVNASINFSNVGKYKFSTKYEKSEILELYCTGNGWANVCEYCTLFQTTDKICISITHTDKPAYHEAAKKLVQELIRFTEDPDEAGQIILSTLL
ncbi:Oidioi.mRNA.OKI2018_I69.chr2.g5240.t1.cds [Oikopleura dioica]|uniref:Oidioi.mRNA.OKI2018_I69.chr2.g5240.t1.cds n=1 Tax=Oikopleura dioica TaxID=34765 RepID=A0ABN7T436_OIKDI|nr:Oidioi.mRNA.OKI2018_I69.chr2.g5240.t1.cds [Oikopleura dioica]